MPRSEDFYEKLNAAKPVPAAPKAQNSVLQNAVSKPTVGKQQVSDMSGQELIQKANQNIVNKIDNWDTLKNKVNQVNKNSFDKYIAEESATRPRTAWEKMISDKPGGKEWLQANTFDGYDLMSVVGIVPQDKFEWTQKTAWEKSKYLASSVKDFAWNTIKALPSTIIKAPISVAYTPLQLFSSNLANLTGKDNLELPASFKLPVVGDVKSMAAMVEEGKKIGLGEAGSLWYGLSDQIGNIAITASLGQAVKETVFNPRALTVDKSYGADLRPLTGEQVSKAKGSMPSASSKAVATKEPIDFSVKQNANVSYMQLSEEVAKKYGGNTGNTYLKISPMGNDMAQYSIVQVRKSLYDQTKDAFASRFGRSKVVQGEMGPELKLDSGVFSVNKGAMTNTKPGMPAAQTELDAISKMTPEDIFGMDKSLNLAYNKSAIQPVVDKAYEQAVKNGGVTISLSGDQPTKGFAYSPDKTTETRFLKDEFKPESIGQFAENHIEMLAQDGNHLGIWFNDEDGKFYIDVSRVGNPDDMTISEAEAADQLAVFDLENFNTVNTKLGEYVSQELEKNPQADTNALIAQYKKNQYEKASGSDISSGQKPATITTRSLEGGGEIQQQLQTAARGKVGIELPSIMAKPLKGFENKLVTAKQTQQIFDIAKNKGIDNFSISAVSKVINGKENINELTQTEAYNVSEAIRGIADNPNNQYDFNNLISRAYSHPARYWMEAAERESGGKYPIYSEVYLPMETGSRLAKADFESWQEKFRTQFGNYAGSDKVEDRRLITAYLEGDKKAILENDSLSATEKAELTDIAEYMKAYYKDAFLSGRAGIESTRFFENYSSKIRKSSGIKNLFKDQAMPSELKTFIEFEREGMLDVLEDDALVLADIYAKALGRRKFISPAYDNAQLQIAKLPENLKNSTADYLAEKMGYKDAWEKDLNNIADKISTSLGFKKDSDMVTKFIDYMMTTSYSGALGLPRISPIVMNSLQLFITTYPEVGYKYFQRGIQRFIKDGANPVKEKGFLINMGVPYGSEMSEMNAQGFAGKAVDKYLQFNKAMMKPYGQTDTFARATTYYAAEERFNDFWKLLSTDKISWAQFEKGINLDSFSPTLRKLVTTKLQSGKKADVEEAKDLMAADIIDRTQFPYRKGAESRLFYGLKGKLGFQFLQWPFEYAHTLKSWVARKQWDKIIRWIAVSHTVKKSFEEAFGIDVRKYMLFGPLLGSIVGPVAKMGMSAVGVLNSAMSDMDDDLNRNWSDMARTALIYGGTLTGVGAQKLQKFYHSMDMYFKVKNGNFNYEAFADKLKRNPMKIDLAEAMKSYTVPLDQRMFDRLPLELKLKWVSQVYPDGMNNPGKVFPLYSSTGKLLRYTTFTDLFRTTLGFQTIEDSAFDSTIKGMSSDSTQHTTTKTETIQSLFK